MEEKEFLEKYEELLNKGYCNCNEMNCIDNNSPRRLLNICKNLQQENAQLKEQISKAIEHCNNEIKVSKEEMTELINTIDKRDCTPTEYEQRRFDTLNRYAWEIKEILNILESNNED